MNTRGFTLIELLIAVAIMVAISAVSVGAYTNALEQQKFESDKVRLNSALELARKTAISNDTSGLTVPCKPFDTQPTILGVKVDFLDNKSYQITKACYYQADGALATPIADIVPVIRKQKLLSSATLVDITNPLQSTPSDFIVVNKPPQSFANASATTPGTPFTSVFRTSLTSDTGPLTYDPYNPNANRTDYMLGNIALKKGKEYTVSEFGMMQNGCVARSGVCIRKEGGRTGGYCTYYDLHQDCSMTPHQNTPQQDN